MTFREIGLGVKIVNYKTHEDERGEFYKMFDKKLFEELGIELDIKQINSSFSTKKGTFRGIHFQRQPYSEYKIIQCIDGSVLDFAVDLRKNSSTQFQFVSYKLFQGAREAIILPPGFGHGFQSLEDNSKLIYFHSMPYMPNFEDGVTYNDDCINIQLPMEITEISSRDLEFKKIDSNFIGI